MLVGEMQNVSGDPSWSANARVIELIDIPLVLHGHWNPANGIVRQQPRAQFVGGLALQ